jgi:hypothetical protein
MSKSTRSEYLKHFEGEQTQNKKQKEALKHALDIRKFEIELYWKRAAYFWTFIAAAFAAFFLLSRTSSSIQFEMCYLVSSMGLVFSFGWYLVNRGSKAWQRNWEAHVDLLEDEVMGPLYKMTINRYRYDFLDPTDAFPFSVSKINQLLSLFVVAIWIFLLLYSLSTFQVSKFVHWFALLFISAVSGTAVWLLIKQGQTTMSDEKIVVDLRVREYADETENSNKHEA